MKRYIIDVTSPDSTVLKRGVTVDAESEEEAVRKAAAGDWLRYGGLDLREYGAAEVGQYDFENAFMSHLDRRHVLATPDRVHTVRCSYAIEEDGR